MMSRVRKLHHVAYRCRDAARTVDFYTKALGLKFTMAMSEQRVPSTGALCPYMHIFFEMADGSHVAFFDLPEEPGMQLDPNTPPWVQHLAMEVDDASALDEAVAGLKAYGVEVIGPIDHAIFQSIYFHDPDGHRLELTYRTESEAMLKALAEAAQPMVEEWSRNKTPVATVAWVHNKQPA